MFYQTLSLMSKKEQLLQNLVDCQRLLANSSDMIQIMIKTVNRGEKADEICELDEWVLQIFRTVLWSLLKVYFSQT